MLRTVRATQYVTPLREGGSLPAIVEGDDDGTYVLKFRGAGQGVRALVAELVAGELGRTLGLPVPEIVFAEVDPRLGKTEPDREIQDLLRGSEGINLALDYLPGSITYDPAVDRAAATKPLLASSIVWFDALVTNVDRTPRNTNLLVWHRELWMIDHGAALYFHHAWDDPEAASRSAFPPIRSHVLLPLAREIEQVDALLDRMVSVARRTERWATALVDVGLAIPRRAVRALRPSQWLGRPDQRYIWAARIATSVPRVVVDSLYRSTTRGSSQGRRAA